MLADATGSRAIAALDGATLLGERAIQRGLRIPGRVSAGGGCRLYEALGGVVALNIARADDRALLPALFGAEHGALDDEAIAACIARSDALDLVARGREMGLAIAAEREPSSPVPACERLTTGPACAPRTQAPRILDLTSTWAGPLSAHLLALAGADVVRIESETRPDAMRAGDPALFTLLNRGKASLALELTEPRGRARLLDLIARADIVIVSSRPRALAQLGVDAETLVLDRPGLVWINITGHGAGGDAAHWIGFGDDCAVAAGISAQLRAVTGRSGFVGDAIGDPLTGIRTALAAWTAWQDGIAQRIGVSMRGVVSEAIVASPDLSAQLAAWAANEDAPFPDVDRRTPLPHRALPEWARC